MASSDPIVRAYEPVAGLLALFGHTPESYGGLIRQLGREIDRELVPDRLRQRSRGNL
jgi:hypothetical protein